MNKHLHGKAGGKDRGKQAEIRNIQSLNNKLDKISAQVRFQRDIQNCNILMDKTEESSKGRCMFHDPYLLSRTAELVAIYISLLVYVYSCM